MSGKSTSMSTIDPTHDRAATAADALRVKDFDAPTVQRWFGRIWARWIPPSFVTLPSASPAPIRAGAATATMGSAAVVPVSWPNHGFRNVSRRGTKGR
jgi:hypothetical protein